MKIVIDVEYEDGRTETVRATTKDMSRFEEERNIAVAGGHDFTIKELAWLAWSAKSRRNANVGPFDAWWDSVDDISPQSEATPPLESNQSTG